MTMLPDFRLETYFSKWEFAAKYHLTASDMQTTSLKDLLALADEDALQRWENLQLSYTESYGMPELRESIAALYENVSSEDVLCFAGAEEGLYLAMKVLLSPEDHAVVVTPNYQAAETIPLSICDVTGVALSEDNNWALDVDAVRAALRPNTRLISINFPNNPTGAIPDKATWRALATLCDDRDIYLFSDEVYRGLELDPDITLPQAADLTPKALSLNVLSKSYGLPGLRIGWIACRDRSVLDKLEHAKHYTSICNSAPSEVLGLIALRAGNQLQEKNRKIIAGNMPIFTQFFDSYPHLFEWSEPQGGCVAFPRYLGPDGVEAMCGNLVEEAGITLLPSSIYKSELTATPKDRFRVGVGRLGAEEALGVWADWLEKRS